MGDHRFRMQKPSGHHLERFFDVLGVAARGPHKVVRFIVDVVEVEIGREFWVGRTSKEVEATILAK